MWNNWSGASSRAAILASGALLSACGVGSPVLREANKGLLAPCPSAPHCVSSLATDDKRVEPLSYAGAAIPARERLAKTLAGLDGYAVQVNEGDYVYATYTSGIMRYVDDLEFVLSQRQPGLIEVRSSSRIGYYDFGANRGHVEQVRAAYAAAAR